MYPGLIDQLLALYDPSYHDDIDGTPASTPKLNTLAQQGMRFRNAWAQPVCSPTRASIITGLFAAKHHVIDFNTPLHPNYDTFVQKLKNEAGYSTAAFGKWHLRYGWHQRRTAEAGGIRSIQRHPRCRSQLILDPEQLCHAKRQHRG